ncbi:HlyD family secretion protein [Prosthecomicrobium sp. N25]|uniref:HlyD family secretion protein n=1 Tax=Prosthecomicrobium sp. N25 TaxID=3129254 RepID=UPI0030781519
MLELMLCSMFTLLPDWLYRRFVQGKRFGREITIYSVWYELRYGITGCLFLTVMLITVIFYFHPASTNVATLFRSIPILPDGSGRVAEVYRDIRGEVKAGDPIFRLDDSTQRAAVDTARRKIEETEAAMKVAQVELGAADSRIAEAEAALEQAQNEYDTRAELLRRNAATVSVREVERLKVQVDGRQAAVQTARVNKQSLEVQLSTLLPSQKASAEAALAQAQVELAKTVVKAGVDGRLEQFTLKVGDIVNPFMRPAGILIPATSGRRAVVAGFGQIEAQVMKPGMIAEITCAAKPMAIIPMVVTEVQDVIASGQVRPTDVLVDPSKIGGLGGTITVFMEPLFAGGTDDLPPGSACVANAYTSNHEALQDPNISTGRWVFLHLVDTVALVHALILRIQAIMLPVQTLVFKGH